MPMWPMYKALPTGHDLRHSDVTEISGPSSENSHFTRMSHSSSKNKTKPVSGEQCIVGVTACRS